MRGGLLAVALLAGAWQGNQPAPPTSGVDRSGFSASARPQDDLFEYVNGGWLETTSIPDQRVTYGTFVELSEQVEGDLRAIIEETAAGQDLRKGTAPQQMADLYRSMLDEERVEELGAAPLLPVLRRIDAIRSAGDMAEVAGHLSSRLGRHGSPRATSRR